MLLSCLELGLNQGQPTALGPGANTDTKLLIYGLFQKGRVLAQDGIREVRSSIGMFLKQERDSPRWFAHVFEYCCDAADYRYPCAEVNAKFVERALLHCRPGAPIKDRKEDETMTEVKDGGPAFPVPSEDSGPGMSLRDWFAGQALGGLSSQWSLDRKKLGTLCEYLDTTPEKKLEVFLLHCKDLAVVAYALADALLDEGEGEKNDA